MSDFAKVMQELESAEICPISATPEYLEVDELKAGDEFRVIYGGYRFEITDKVDEKTGVISKVGRHTVRFLSYKDGAPITYVSSSRKLAESIGMLNPPMNCPMKITYKGKKQGKDWKYADWSVELLNAKIPDLTHLLPEWMTGTISSDWKQDAALLEYQELVPQWIRSSVMQQPKMLNDQSRALEHGQQ